MEKSSKEMGWQVVLVWAWMAEREEQVNFLPLKGEIPKCSEIRGCKCSAALTLIFINFMRSH